METCLFTHFYCKTAVYHTLIYRFCLLKLELDVLVLFRLSFCRWDFIIKRNIRIHHPRFFNRITMIFNFLFPKTVWDKYDDITCHFDYIIDFSKSSQQNGPIFDPFIDFFFKILFNLFHHNLKNRYNFLYSMKRFKIDVFWSWSTSNGFCRNYTIRWYWKR